MYITVTKKKYKDTYHKQTLLRESYREDGKVKTRTIANLTNKPEGQVAAIAEALKDSNKEKFSIDNLEQGKTIGFSLIIYFLMRILGIKKAFNENKFESKVAQLLIMARIVIQSSRLQALRWSQRDHVLNILEIKEKLNNKNIYLGLDYMYENKIRLENSMFKTYYKNKAPKKFFYDVTSSYVEGDYNESELVQYGYNRDGKKGKQQIVIGLLSDEDGHGISIDTYPGNTNDVKTFIDQLNKLKKRFKLDNVTIIGDGGMIKNSDILTIKEYGYDYITSIGKPSIKKLIKEEIIDISLFDEELKDIIDDKTNTRYILRCNPIKAIEIKNNRDEKIELTKQFIQKKIEYYNTHLKASKETLKKNIDKKILNLKLSSFVKYEIKYNKGNCQMTKDGNSFDKEKDLATITINIDNEQLKEMSKLDGCYVIKTSLINTDTDTKEKVHKNYKTLIKVENAFKTLKTDYLEIRPLYIKTDNRIKSHVFISMISYNIVLKLKEYIKISDLDFKDTIEQLKIISTVKNKINKIISFEFIPKVNENIQKLFDNMKFKLPNKI